MNYPPAAVRLAIAGRTSKLARITRVGVLCVAAAACGQTPASSAPPSPDSSPAGSLSSVVATAPAQPPVAWLSVPPATGSAGALGSYTWLGAGSDSPWLPGAAVSLPRGGTAAVTFQPAVPAVSWRVRRATASGEAVQLVAEGRVGLITFVVPDDAATIEVAVDYGPAGSVVWYWAVTPVP